MIKDVVEYYGKFAQIDIMQEECAELIKACSKLKRAKSIGYITPTDQEQAMADLIEEMAHVKNTIISTCYLYGISENVLDEEIARSDTITLNRLKESGIDPQKENKAMSRQRKRTTDNEQETK